MAGPACSTQQQRGSGILPLPARRRPKAAGRRRLATQAVAGDPVELLSLASGTAASLTAALASLGSPEAAAGWQASMAALEAALPAPVGGPVAGVVGTLGAGAAARTSAFVCAACRCTFKVALRAMPPARQWLLLSGCLPSCCCCRFCALCIVKQGCRAGTSSPGSGSRCLSAPGQHPTQAERDNEPGGAGTSPSRVSPSGLMSQATRPLRPSRPPQTCWTLRRCSPRRRGSAVWGPSTMPFLLGPPPSWVSACRVPGACTPTCWPQLCGRSRVRVLVPYSKAGANPLGVAGGPCRPAHTGLVPLACLTARCSPQVFAAPFGASRETSHKGT